VKFEKRDATFGNGGRNEGDKKRRRGGNENVLRGRAVFPEGEME